MNLPQPKTNKQEVLYTLIEKGSVSIMDYPYLSSFRTRISELRNDIKLQSENVLKFNKSGNHYTYVKHKLSVNDRQKAIELYNQLTK